MDNFDFAEIAKTLGGIIAFALVLYVGVIFYRREADFSAEYEILIDQYKERNQELLKEIASLKQVVEEQAEKRDEQLEKLRKDLATLTAGN